MSNVAYILYSLACLQLFVILINSKYFFIETDDEGVQVNLKRDEGGQVNLKRRSGKPAPEPSSRKSKAKPKARFKAKPKAKSKAKPKAKSKFKPRAKPKAKSKVKPKAIPRPSPGPAPYKPPKQDNPPSMPISLHGRPFIVQGKSRTTSSQTCSSSNLERTESWKIGEAPSVVSSNPHNQEIGHYWLNIAEAEHASVASFARHTLQLISIGAPSRLLVASQKASVDEIKHAKMCYGLASEFIGSDLGPGSLDVLGSLESMDLNGIIQSLIIEGCIGETLSAIEAHLAAHNAQDSAVKSAVSEIAFDETKHAQLAWDTIKWIIEKYPDSRTFAEEIFHVELKQRMMPVRNDSSLPPVTLCNDAKVTTFHRYGVLVSGDREKVREAGILNIIEPHYHAGFKDVNMISKQIKELDVATLAREARI